MENPIQDLKKAFNYCRDKGIQPNTLLVPSSQKEMATAAVKEAGIPVEVVTPDEYRKGTKRKRGPRRPI